MTLETRNATKKVLSARRDLYQVSSTKQSLKMQQEAIWLITSKLGVQIGHLKSIIAILVRSGWTLGCSIALWTSG